MTNNVTNIDLWRNKDACTPVGLSPKGGGTYDGGNGGEPPMEERIANLEGAVEHIKQDLTGLKTDVAVVKSNYATKADVSDAKTSIIMWVVSAFILTQLLPPILKKFGL